MQLQRMHKPHLCALSLLHFLPSEHKGGYVCLLVTILISKLILNCIICISIYGIASRTRKGRAAGSRTEVCASLSSQYEATGSRTVVCACAGCISSGACKGSALVVAIAMAPRQVVPVLASIVELRIKGGRLANGGLH